MRVLLLGAFVACAAACSYDWTVGPPPVADDGGAQDVATGSDGAAPAEASSCATLKAKMDAAKPGARACSGTCNQTLTDECGCDFAVGDDRSGGAVSYELAEAAFLGALCPKSCGTSCAPQTTSSCVNGSCTP